MIYIAVLCNPKTYIHTYSFITQNDRTHLRLSYRLHVFSNLALLIYSITISAAQGHCLPLSAAVGSIYIICRRTL